jgi:hypothetical protein
MSLIRSLIVLALLALVAPVDPALADGPRRDRTAQADKAEKKRAKLKKKIRTMRAIVLAEELDLDEDTAAKLFPILNKYDDEFAKLAKESLDIRAKIDAANDSGDDDDLDDLVDDLMDNQRARWDLDEDRFKAVRKVLTPKQAARILVVLPEIDRKILQGVKKAIAGKTGKKAKAGKKGKKGKKAAPQDDGILDPFSRHD